MNIFWLLSIKGRYGAICSCLFYAMMFVHSLGPSEGTHNLYCKKEQLQLFSSP